MLKSQKEDKAENNFYVFIKTFTFFFISERKKPKIQNKEENKLLCFAFISFDLQDGNFQESILHMRHAKKLKNF